VRVTAICLTRLRRVDVTITDQQQAFRRLRRDSPACRSLHGGYGYLRDFPVERALRDAKLGSPGGGTSEIQKLIISRLLLGAA
jgi:hypothetical protein